MAETGLEEILKVETDRGTNPIPHPKERQRTGEAVSSRHTGNSVSKTLDRVKAKRQYDKKGVLNRRFKRLFGDFFAAEKVTPPAGGSSCGKQGSGANTATAFTFCSFPKQYFCSFQELFGKEYQSSTLL